MLENDTGKLNIALESPHEQGGEQRFDENTRMQNELMGLRTGIEGGKVTPITSEQISRLEKRNLS